MRGGATASGGGTGDGESLRCAIVDLVRIVDLANNPRHWGAATNPFLVHILGRGVTPAGGSPTWTNSCCRRRASPPGGGACIVRLKGGNPFVFRRTRTEIDALQLSGVPYT
jgi:hypothetical protein